MLVFKNFENHIFSLFPQIAGQAVVIIHKLYELFGLKYSEKETSEKLEKRVLVFSDEKNSKTEFLTSIQSAIVNSPILKIKYHTIYSDLISERAVEPMVVYFTKENWLLIAHCRLRNKLRKFRIDRILKLNTTKEPFTD